MNIDFKQQIKIKFIPAIEKMIVKETEHLATLHEYNTDFAFMCLKRSKETLIHLKERLQQYEDYIKE